MVDGVEQAILNQIFLYDYCWMLTFVIMEKDTVSFINEYGAF